MDVTVAGANRRVLQRRRVRVDGWTSKRRQTFLDVLAATCNVRRAAGLAGMNVTSAYRLRQRDDDFAGLWREAVAMGYERLENELLRHALQSVNDIDIAVAEDPAAGLVDEIRDPVTGQLTTDGAPLSNETVRLLLMVLDRQRRAVEGRGRPRPPVQRATAEETDAALIKKLDSLAKRLATEA